MKAALRTLAFVRKEIVDIGRQPALLVALVIGPFAILLTFGAGLRETDPPLAAQLVVSEDSEIRDQVQAFSDDHRDRGRLVIDDLSDDEAAARALLRAGETDLIIVFPDEVSSAIEADEQAVIRLYHRTIDPIETQAIQLFSRLAVNEINDQLLVDVIEQAQAAVGETGLTGAAEEATSGAGPDDAERSAAERAGQLLELEPAVLVSPFRPETSTLGGATIGLNDFYAPAVVVVLLQHLAVTLLALSVVRERQLGATRLYRVSPLRSGEYLAGKYLAFLVLGAVVGTLLIVGLVFALGIPMLGSWWHLVAALAVLLIASSAVGLVTAMVATSDSQAVQYSMLVLLATIFLSGFLLSLERFLPFAEPIAWLLPATYGITMVRDIMLRGVPIDLAVLGGLALYALAFSVLAVRSTHRMLRRTGV